MSSPGQGAVQYSPAIAIQPIQSLASGLPVPHTMHLILPHVSPQLAANIGQINKLSSTRKFK
eukprot:3074392-Amphidinium_carterae.1